jgi:hypothetical protein
MPSFYSKPSSQKNAVRNYSDHLDALGQKFMDKYANLYMQGKYGKIFDLISEEALDHLNMFEAIKDGHDLTDELLLGTMAIPAMSTVASLALVGNAIYEASMALYRLFKPNKYDREDHLSNAVEALALAGLVFSIGVASFLTSAISLITRPIATLINGYAKQTGDRFLREGRTEGLLNAAEEEVSSWNILPF